MIEMLTNARVIAVVGHSDQPHRTSYQIAHYLRQAGYRVYPVNPTVQMIDGERSYATLADVPEPIDIVNVFRRSEYLADIVHDAVAVGAKGVWAQLGVIDPSATDIATAVGIPLVMNECIQVWHSRYL